MSDAETNGIPDELLENRSRSIVACLNAGKKAELSSFGQAAATQILSAWNKTEEVHGDFTGVDDIVVDPDLDNEVDMEPSERVVEVYGSFGEEPFKVQIFFTSKGEPKGLYILRRDGGGLMDSVGDAKRIGKSKVSSIASRFRNRGQQLTDEEREIVTDVIDKLDQGQYRPVYEMLTDELQQQVTVEDIKSGWLTHVESFEGIENMHKDQGIIQVSLADASGSKEFFVTVAEDGSLGTLRIRDK